MKKYQAVIVVGLIVSIISGCYYDKSDTLFPPQSSTVAANTCDTANMKFSTNIKPILDANCVSCHSTNSTNGGRNFWSIETPSTLQTKALNGALMFRITLPADDIRKMPKGLDKPKLDTCNILKIRAWVNRGANINN